MSDIHVEPGSGSGRPESRLRALWRQPPVSVVAVASALVGAATVAVYMDRPVEIVQSDPSTLRLNPVPESWLNVSVSDVPEPAQSGEELERMLARHPADATVTVPVERQRENLVALPTGTYHIRASCSAEPVPPADHDGPAWFTVDILVPSSYDPAPGSSTGRAELVCDGEPHTVSTGMTVSGYQPFTVVPNTAVDEQAEMEGGTAVPGTLVVISFTPAG